VRGLIEFIHIPAPRIPLFTECQIDLQDTPIGLGGICREYDETSWISQVHHNPYLADHRDWISEFWSECRLWVLYGSESTHALQQQTIAAILRCQSKLLVI
jgi:hypothetical protein